LLLNFIELFIFSLQPDISSKSLKELKKKLFYKCYEKDTNLISEEKFYILKSGVIKSNIQTTDNKKYNTKLFIPDSKSTIISNILNIPKSNNNTYKCLTKVELYECTYKAFIGLVEEDFEISKFYNRLLEYQSILNEKRIDDLVELNTKQRYLKLLEEIPYIEKLIPKYQIANYLNISPVQLTRIRKGKIS